MRPEVDVCMPLYFNMEEALASARKKQLMCPWHLGFSDNKSIPARNPRGKNQAKTSLTSGSIRDQPQIQASATDPHNQLVEN